MARDDTKRRRAIDPATPKPKSTEIARPRRATKRKTDSLTPSLFADLPDRIQVEKSVTTMGFFSVRSGIPKDGNLERTVAIERNTESGRVEAKATIAALKATGGFPGVEEQDVYYAILSAVGEAMANGEEIPMPLTFAPGELIRRMGKASSGENYKALAVQLKRLAGTTVVSERSIYRAATKTWEDSDHLFRVIDRVLTKGERKDDGAVAQEHHIWLSSWQIENLRGRHRLMVDYQRYLTLNKPIAKAIIPYLQLWLYASMREGRKRCERLYEPLCKLLDIKVEKNAANIKKQLTGPFRELVEAGYISKWAIESAGGVFAKRFKIVFFHGAAFLDMPELLEASSTELDRVPPSLDKDDARQYAELLVEKGVWAREAQKLARGLTREQWARSLHIVDYVRQRNAAGQIANPGGFLAALLRADRLDPVTLEPTARGRRAADVAVAGASPEFDAEILRDAAAELTRFRAFEAETDAIIHNLAPGEKADLFEEAVKWVARDHPTSSNWSPELREKQQQVYFRRLVRQRY